MSKGYNSSPKSIEVVETLKIKKRDKNEKKCFKKRKYDQISNRSHIVSSRDTASCRK